jgi:hypothetical protein
MTASGGDRLYLGWQYAALCPEPGPPPRRPTPPEAERLNPDWAAAQRREESLLNRPLKAALVAAVVIGVAVIGCGAAGWLNAFAAGLVVICCVLVAGLSGYAIWLGERALRSRLVDERHRVAMIRAVQQSKLSAAHADHAARIREWEELRVAYEHQKRWYAVCAPAGIHRVDLAGGTLAGWSAMLTTAGAHRIAAGGEVTVVDLSEGPVALDLISFARASGIEPLVWVLPEDLPGLDLGTGLGASALADLLSLTISVSEESGQPRDLSFDNAILERVIDALGGTATVAGVAAALRTLTQVGDPRQDVAAGLLSAAQVDRLRATFGRGAADRVVIERAWMLESQLRKLAATGTAPVPLPPSPLRVVAVGSGAGAVESRVLGTYLTVALTHALREDQPRRPWQHTLFLLGADRLRDEVVDRLCGACESTGTGLVLAYRAIPQHVRQRLGRGNAAVAFMRLGNAEDAKAASEQLGTEHRFVLSQLTDTIGRSVTGTTSGSYTSTAGSASSVAGSWSVSEGTSRSTGHTRAHRGGVLPSLGSPSRSMQAGDSRSTGESESVSASINTSTAWGITTSTAAGDSQSLALALQRTREFLVEQHELQQLPPSAMIISYAGLGGRQVVMADVNPGIGGLRAATMLTLEEFRGRPAAAAGPPEPRHTRPAPDRRHARPQPDRRHTGPPPEPGGSGDGPEARAGTGPRAAGGSGPRAAGGSGPRAAGGSGPPTPTGGGQEAPAPGAPGPASAAPVSWRSGRNRPPPNLGPPPPRLDWRKRRS